MNDVLNGGYTPVTTCAERVQNILARVVVGAPWTCSSLNIRRDLHWLPVDIRITYKLCLTTWKTLHTSLISFLTIFRTDPCILLIQISLPGQPTSNFSSRAFYVSAPSPWQW